MSSRVWKFLSNTIGKLQSPRPSQQDQNPTDSSSLPQNDSTSDTPTRHGNGNSDTLGGQLVDTTVLPLVQDGAVPDTPLNKNTNSFEEKLEEAVKPTPKIELQEGVREDVTAINTFDDEDPKNPKSTKRTPNDGSFAKHPPRYGRNKRREVAETAEPLAQTEPPVEASSRTTRGRGGSGKAKKAEAVVYDETLSCTPHGESTDLGDNIAEAVEPLTINESPVDSSLSSHKPRGRGRPSRAAKAVVYAETSSDIRHGESSAMEVDNIEEVIESSVRNEDSVQPQTNASIKARRMPPRVEEPANTPETLIITSPVGNKRRRDILESSTGNEGPEIETPGKRRKLAPKPEGMGIPPLGTTQAAKDERRKYMDRERQRRCRQRKKERQQGQQAVEREVVSQAKDERKKAMARERVRRHRDNQRQKRGHEVEATMGDRQRVREEARQRDRELIAFGGRRSAAPPAANDTSNTE